jgi:hypothetical protein
MTAEGAGRLTQIDFEKWWDLYKLRLPSWKREGAKSWVRLGYDLRTEEIDALREDNQRLRDREIELEEAVRKLSHISWANSSDNR